MKEFADLSASELAFRAALTKHFATRYGQSRFSQWAELVRKDWTVKRSRSTMDAGAGNPLSPELGARRRPTNKETKR